MGILQKWQEKRVAKKQQAELEKRNPQLMRGQDEYSFRRSRTLTGSTSSQIKSSSESQAQLKSPRLKAQELRHHRRKLFGLLVLVLFGGALLLWLLTQFTARIGTVTFTPAVQKAPDTELYSETIQEYLSGRPIERFQLALRENALTDYVQTKHPEVTRVQIVPNPAIGANNFRISLRQPIVGWTVGGHQYFVDDEGVSFTANYFTTPKVLVEDQSGITPERQETQAIASNRFLSFLGRIVSLTESTGTGIVKKVTIPAGIGSRSIEVQLEGKKYPIRMHIDRDPAAQVEDMRQAVEYFDAAGRTPEYIDIRVKGKAFYKEG